MCKVAIYKNITTNNHQWRFHAKNTKLKQSITDGYPNQGSHEMAQKLKSAYFTFYDEFEGPILVQIRRIQLSTTI